MNDNRAGRAKIIKNAERGLSGQVSQESSGPALIYSGSAQKLPKDFPIYFDRKELNILLNVYGKRVAKGEWRDYAMDFVKDRALFSIYRRTSEQPLFVIEKQPKLRLKQGQYLVINQAGRILKRGHDLKQVLTVFDSKVALVN